ncbi:nucleophile aminohydrolase [Vibrio phage 1.121.O._10N.286.46.C4]|nr:nucleophile aminohydrolase [Vibrio phage 1.121.O._10N.286.46.C4]
MTTIVYRDGVMMGDGQATRGEFIDNYNEVKVFKIDNILVGFSGSYHQMNTFLPWFRKNQEISRAKEEWPDLDIPSYDCEEEGNFHAMAVYPDGSIFEFASTKKVLPVKESYFAVGSGMYYAISAMDAGATAEKAIEIAIYRDLYTGGKVTKVEFDKEVPEEPESEDLTVESSALSVTYMGAADSTAHNDEGDLVLRYPYFNGAEHLFFNTVSKTFWDTEGGDSDIWETFSEKVALEDEGVLSSWLVYLVKALHLPYESFYEDSEVAAILDRFFEVNKE